MAPVAARLVGLQAEATAAELLRLSPAYAPTPLLELPSLAAEFGVAQVLVKDEGRRFLGSFKSLGGTYAGMRALARLTGCDIGALLSPGEARRWPTLICASDGNHGLAVAAAARLAGGSARIFLHSGVPAARVRRIESQGAEIVWIDGTYDDAVDAASAAAAGEGGLLIADTTADAADPVVGDVMAGYGVIGWEIRRQAREMSLQPPTHAFVQAGVGGLAAAITAELRTWMAPPATIVVVEPERAACVGDALATGQIARLAGELHTAAEMLSCGEASRPAFDILRRAGVQAMAVSEAALKEAPALLRRHDGPATTESGATGLAALAALAGDRNKSVSVSLDDTSRVLLIVTEAMVE